MKATQIRELSLALLLAVSSGTLPAQQVSSATANPNTEPEDGSTAPATTVAVPTPATPKKPKQLTPFKPTEKIRADDAVAFPVDI